MKNNDSDSTLRKDDLPKAEKVLQANSVKGAAVKAARNQNSDSDGNLAVLPKTHKK